MTKITAAITSVQGYVPERVLSNADLEKMVDTNDEWITSRTGIKERRMAAPGEALSDFGAKIIEGICKKRGISPLEIDLVVVGSITGDYRFPSASNVMCDKAGCHNAWGFDLGAACSGFLYALDVGRVYVENGTYNKVIVIGADVMSSIINYEDRATCIIFGDGGGGVLLEPNEEGLGIIDTILKADGSGRQFLLQEVGGSKEPLTKDNIDERRHFVYQDGQPVFKNAVRNMADVAAEIMEKNQLTSEDVNWLVPHQANLRIIDATANRMGLDKERVMVNIQKFGNTTAGTIPLCLWEWENQLNKGDNLILASFGGGFTWGAVYLKWAY